VKRPGGRAAARLDALAAEWSLDPGAVESLGLLLAMVRDDARAATSVRDPAEAVDVHVADSLTALPVLDRAAPSAQVADIGSGAGFPGLPLAIARPGMQVHLIEATRRKCDFMETAVAALQLGNVTVVNARAEDWARAAGRERYAAVLARAVAPLATLAEYAAPLLAIGGLLVAWKGARAEDEERAGAAAAAALGMRPLTAERVRPYPGSRAHTLHLYEKVRATPAEFPRRAGSARKQPLGA